MDSISSGDRLMQAGFSNKEKTSTFWRSLFSIAFCRCFFGILAPLFTDFKLSCIFYAAHWNNWHTHKSHFWMRYIQKMCLSACQTVIMFFFIYEIFCLNHFLNSFKQFIRCKHSCAAVFTAILFDSLRNIYKYKHICINNSLLKGKKATKIKKKLVKQCLIRLHLIAFTQLHAPAKKNFHSLSAC